MKEIHFFGQVLCEDSLKPHPSLTKALVDVPAPYITSLRSFLGIVGYYSKFCPDNASIIEPMRSLLCKDNSFVWSDEVRDSFSIVQNLISTHLTLAYLIQN